jgi:hypothetical protein
MTTDEKALATLRQPGWDPNGLHDQYVTEDAVLALMAPYRDTFPNGRPLHEHRLGESWQGPRNAAGNQTYLPSLWAILDHVADTKDLTDRQVIHLVMTSTDNESYRPEEWEAMVDGKIADAKVRQEADRRSKRHNLDYDERAKRGGRERLTLDRLPGQRVIPDEALSQRTKMRRTKSLKAAQERRELRRKITEGIVVQPRKDDWRAMTSEDVKQYHQTIDRLIAQGTIEAVMGDELTDPEGSPIAYLHRLGRMASKGDRL